MRISAAEIGGFQVKLGGVEFLVRPKGLISLGFCFFIIKWG